MAGLLGHISGEDQALINEIGLEEFMRRIKTSAKARKDIPIKNHAGDLSCGECYDILDYTYNAHNDITGFKCPKCKYTWLIL